MINKTSLMLHELKCFRDYHIRHSLPVALSSHTVDKNGHSGAVSRYIGSAVPVRASTQFREFPFLLFI